MRIFSGSEGLCQVTRGHLDLAEVGVRQSAQDQVTSGCRGGGAKFTRPQGGGRVSKMKRCLLSPEKKFGRKTVRN